VLDWLKMKHQTFSQEARESSSWRVFLVDNEENAMAAAEMERTLVEFAPDPAGQAYIDRVLAPMLPNPYQRYRDIALVAMSIAVLAVPDPNWVRHRLRQVLQVGLDQEGILFTFDLPSVLVEETSRRGLASGALGGYVQRAYNAFDRWGTAVLAHSARAAALFRQGRQPRRSPSCGMRPRGTRGTQALPPRRCCSLRTAGSSSAGRPRQKRTSKGW